MRHRVAGTEPCQPLGLVVAERHPGAGGLQAEEAAVAGRYPDRSPAVGRVGRGKHARGHRTGGPAARPAGAAPCVEGVRRRAEERRRSADVQSELRGVGLSEDDQARGPVAPDELSVVRRDEVAEGTAAVGRGGAAHPGVQVLHQPGHTAERAFRQPPAQRFPCFVEERRDHRIESRIQRFDPRDCALDDLFRRNLAPRNEGSEARCVVAPVLLLVQGRTPSVSVRQPRTTSTVL